METILMLKEFALMVLEWGIACGIWLAILFFLVVVAQSISELVGNAFRTFMESVYNDADWNENDSRVGRC